MKKISLILFVIIATTFTACGNNNVENISDQENIQIEEKNDLNKDDLNKDENLKEEDNKYEDKEDLEILEVESKSKKDEYLKKLDDIESGLTDLNKLSSSGKTLDMKEAAAGTYKRWDDALNEIYEELKLELSSSEMDKLTEKQLEWISYRDKTAKENSLKFEGGTMERLEYISTLANITKERCYELVSLYMY